MTLTKIKTTGLFLLEVKAKYPKCFFQQSWYDKENFANDKPEAGEYEFDFTSKHTNKTYEGQAEMLQKGTDFPHPAVLAEALCIHFTETGERLMADWHSRTSFFDLQGCRILIGGFDTAGFFVDQYDWDSRRDFPLGVAASRLVSGNLDPVEPFRFSF